MSIAYLGLGSNLGDRLANLQNAVDLLGADPSVSVTGSSRVWETEPVGGPSQADFLNAVVRVDTSLTPSGLLDVCHRVEIALHRVRDERWGPRTIDVDVLLFEREVSDDPELTLPHPRMAERAFVVLPLLELDPKMQLPDGTPLVSLPTGGAGGVRPFAPPLVTERA